MERHGIAPTKALGQNFLVDDNVVGRILELSEASADDIVVEVGPGIGTLTSALLSRCSGVVAIERDRNLPPVLRDTLGGSWDSLNLVEMDALDVEAVDLACGRRNDVTFVPKDLDARLSAPRFVSTTRTVSQRLYPNKLISNLPYSVAATIVLDYFQRFGFIDSMTVMVQKEVARRMQAEAGSKDYGAYTVKLALHARPMGSFDVSRNCFMPAPHVDSTVIRLDRIDAEGSSSDDGEAASLMADAAFASRRKTIANSMKAFFSGRGELDVADVPKLLEMAGIDPSVRGERLSVDDYRTLGRAFVSLRERCRSHDRSEG